MDLCCRLQISGFYADKVATRLLHPARRVSTASRIGPPRHRAALCDDCAPLSEVWLGDDVSRGLSKDLHCLAEFIYER